MVCLARRRLWSVVLVVASLAGCARTQVVRYVYQDRDFGVVGLPENTDRWPTHYRRQAEQLMDSHFPQGHEIVRAEEVVEGERTLKVEGSRHAEFEPELARSLLKVAKRGHSASRTQADTVKIKERRIIYRRAGGPEKGYVGAAILTPTLAVDPNTVERRKAREPPSEKAKPHRELKKGERGPSPRTGPSEGVPSR
jgi:hypothetical protein